MSEIDLKPFEFKVFKDGIHLKTHSCNNTYYLCAWCIPNFSTGILHAKDFPDKRFFILLNVQPGQAEIGFISSVDWSKWDISIFTDSGEIPLCKKRRIDPSNYSRCFHRVFVEGENLKKLEKLPNSACIIICRMIGTVDLIVPKTTIISVITDSKQNSDIPSQETVILRIGEETEVVNKAVLCAKSPVFATMFSSDMRELKENTVIITDIEMPVLKILVSFLNSGILNDCGYDSLCDLYYVADKYDIKDLQLTCTGELLSKVSLKNILQVLKLSSLHNDQLLKSAAMTFISANIETLVLTSDWETLNRDDSKLALEASTYFSL